MAQSIKRAIALFSCIFAGALSCTTGVPVTIQSVAPEIINLEVVSVTDSSATLTATVNSASQVSECGFTVSINNDNKDVPAILEGSGFSATVSGLQAASEYSCSAYITNGAGLRKNSDTLTFMTPEPEKQPSAIQDPVFLAWILQHYDSDGDGDLSPEEAEHVKEIDVNTDNVSTLSDLSLFPNLVKLDAGGTRVQDAGFGKLTELDVHANNKLRHIQAPHNQFQSIALPENKGTLVHMDITMNSLTEIDLRSYSRLNLVSLALNRFTKLDFSGLDNLDELHVDGNPLEEIKLDNKILRYIDLHGTVIKTVDFSRCPKLNDVDCTDCPKLSTIYLAKGQVIGNLRTDGSVSIVYHD